MKHRSTPSQEMRKIEDSDFSQYISQTDKGSLRFISDPPQSEASSRQIPSYTSIDSNNEKSKDSKNGERLKLKDYLHLASLEKRSKSKPMINTSANQSQLDILSPLNATSPLLLINRKLENGATSEKSNSIRKESFIQQIKQDISLKIERQIKQLQDLKRFTQTKFEQNKNPEQTRVFMFQFYNTVKDSCQRYDDLGKKIRSLEGRKERDGETTQTNYWEQSGKQLSSPAKMIQRGLKLTYNAFQRMNHTTI